MRKSIVLLLPLGLLLLVCGSGRQNEAAAANPIDKQDIEIVCNFFYRSSASAAKSERKRFTIKVPIVKGAAPEIALNISEKVEFKDLTSVANANYNSLSIHFQSADTKKAIASLLYQFADKPDNRFAGGHGFTGLHYIYHPESGAELQFWAVVKKADSKERK